MNKQNNTQPAQTAPLAASWTIDNSRFVARGWTDGLSGLENLQKWLSDASRGIPCVSLPVQFSPIHNHRLSIVLRQNLALLCTYRVFPLVRIRTSVLGCSGTLDRAEARRFDLHPWQFWALPVGFSLDRTGYPPRKKAREALDPGTQYTLSLAFGACLSTRPVKANDQNEPQRDPAGLPYLEGDAAARRSSVSGAEQVTRTALDTWQKSEVCQ
ncbi:MAG TPA: hypothetical protein VFV38_00185 [Ktedonobacteraceae bacterium]|nr:hypothetical protein [Ktedonobacteraceae bacterium]